MQQHHNLGAACAQLGSRLVLQKPKDKNEQSQLASHLHTKVLQMTLYYPSLQHNHVM